MTTDNKINVQCNQHSNSVFNSSTQMYEYPPIIYCSNLKCSDWPVSDQGFFRFSVIFSNLLFHISSSPQIVSTEASEETDWYGN